MYSIKQETAKLQPQLFLLHLKNPNICVSKFSVEISLRVQCALGTQYNTYHGQMYRDGKSAAIQNHQLSKN